MTTNKPEVFTFNSLSEECVRLSDYEALEVDLADMERDYLVIIEAQDAEHRKQLASLQAECEKLRKDAEFGRSVLSKREPGKVYGCHCDLDEGMEPDGCVIDSGERHNCIYAKDISVKEQCSYWRVIATDAALKEPTQ